MLRTLALAALLAVSIVSPAQQDIEIKQPPVDQKPSSEAPPPEVAPADATKDKSSKVAKKLKSALPDCINIIFHTCPGLSQREKEAAEQAEQRRILAAERCRQLEAARPKAETTPAPAQPQVPASESSSRASIPENVRPPYCTAEDVLAAEHDVEVGDSNLEGKNLKGAEMRYRSAIERLPGDPIATLRLARLLEKTGRKTEAYEQYKIYMSWSPTGKDAEQARVAMAQLEKQMSAN
jgi:hypothetical protein